MSKNNSPIPEQCRVCDNDIKDITERVVCEKCFSPYHATCVLTNDNINAWKCIKCLDGKQNLIPPTAPRSVRSRSMRSMRSNSSQVEIALKIFDEQEEILKQQAAENKSLFDEKEKSLREKHEKQNELMEKKLQLFKEISMIDGRSKCSSSKSSRSMNSKEKVNNWMKSFENVTIEPEGKSCEKKNLDTSNYDVKQSDSIIIPPKLNSNKHDSQSNKPIIRGPTESYSNSQSQPQITNTKAVQSQPTIEHHNQSSFNGPTTSSTFVQPRNSTKSIEVLAPLTNITYVQPPIGQDQIPQITQEPGINSASYQISDKSSLLTKEQIAARHVVKELPHFDGSPDRWSLFFSSFNRSTSLCGFSNAENLERLGHSLRGSALEAVKNCLTLEDNVPRIINTLKMLFGRPDFVINDLLEKLRKESKPRSENIESIIKYSLQVENIADTMKAGGLSEYLWNPQLLQEIIERLPTLLKLEWAECKPNRACSIEELSAWLSDRALKYSSILSHAPVFTKGSENLSKKGFLNVHYSRKCMVCSGPCSDLESCESFLKMELKDKWSIIHEHKLCRTCLKPHASRRCRLNKLCGVDSCEKRHHELLHHRFTTRKPEQVDLESATMPLNLHRDNKEVFYKILPITLYGNNKCVDTYAMLDDGASLTLIEDDLVNELNLTGRVESLCLRWTGDIQRTESSSRRVKLQLSSVNDSESKFEINARTVQSLDLPSQTVNMKSLEAKFSHLKNVPASSYRHVKPRILIGIDYPKLTQISQFKFGADHEPVAGKCKLGWVVFGVQFQQTASIYHINKCSCNIEDTSKFDDLIKYYYTLESIGISSPNILPMSTEDKRASEIIKSTTKYINGRFEIGLLWRYDNITLPSSFNMAFRRLKCLEKQCSKSPGLAEIIDRQILEYIQKGYARKATSKDLDIQNHWYLPIFVVQNVNKPGKVRLVWDAAAVAYNVSLNSMLLKGTETCVSLPGVLQRFRERKVAVTGDIKEMYHQVRISPKDQQFQRFLWRSDPNKDPEVYIMQVMTFGATCSPSCAQFIKDLNADNFKEGYPRAVESIKENHYVDDMLDSVDTDEEAIKLCNDVAYIHKQGGFIIRNWASNSIKVKESLIEATFQDEVLLKVPDEGAASKILGMWWSTSKDCFSFSLQFTKANASILNGETVPTKREVLRLIMSIFDPLGFLSHRMIYGKILMQKVWRLRCSWDDAIPNELHGNWFSWIQALKEVEQIEIPRWYFITSESKEIELHVFCDASEDAFSAVAYFKIISSGEVKTVLVGSKSRVAPLKMISVPRLELQGAILGCRLALTVCKEHRLNVNRRFFWTDSQTVLNWINSEHKRYKQFVACRIGELLEYTRVEEWRWVCSKSNIADLATKMRLPTQQQENDWFLGPAFLQDHEESWPKTKFNEEPTEELRAQYSLHIDELGELIKVQDFSNWKKLLRVQAFVIRYVNNLKLKVNNSNLNLGPITTSEFISAETRLFIVAQRSCYSEELSALRNGNAINKRSPIYKDVPYIDANGLLRANGRIDLATDVPENIKRPILLPKRNDITRLLLQYYHKRYLHKNHETAINEIRQKFAIPQLRREFNSIVKRCQYCKNLSAKPLVPIEGILPAARVTRGLRPFTFVGIDYFGPISVTYKRKTEKRWGVVLTCLTTRAVHLEMAYSLTSASCIICIRNCINRRGKPRIIYSDNGTNFKGASRELKEAMSAIDEKIVAEYFIDSDLEWSFIPPSSPHMGGAWERMVRSVKNTISSIFGTIKPTDEILNSSLIEAENIINSRPLTYVPVSSDVEEALTPNHFLLGSSNGVKPLCTYHEKGHLYRENWKQVQHIADLFWKRWTLEYLPTLCRRTKWFENQKGIEVGDVVVMVGGDQPRNSWPKGRVVEVHEGKDGKIRSVTLQTANGIYKRPVAKLAILDVLDEKDSTSQELSEIPGGGVANVVEDSQ